MLFQMYILQIHTSLHTTNLYILIKLSLSLVILISLQKVAYDKVKITREWHYSTSKTNIYYNRLRLDPVVDHEICTA